MDFREGTAMELKNVFFAAALAAGCAAPALAGKSPEKSVPEAPPADAPNTLAFKLYAKEAAAPGNLFFSPYSIYTAMAMAYEGARGKTAKEMAAALSFPVKAETLRSGLAGLNRDVAAAAQGAEFAQANSFWAQAGHRFLPAYSALLTTVYGAEGMNADFTADPETARGRINSWAEDRTSGRIKDIFQKGALDKDTRLALVNAVYFKGNWSSPFTKAMTGNAEFTRESGTKTTVQMMGFSGTRELQYGETEDFQALRLPYSGGLDMLVALPRAGLKLADAQKKLTPGGLEALRGCLAPQNVKAFLPKFTFSSGLELNSALASLGMPAAFSSAADFSGMDGSRDLYLQRAVHKAFIDVNEEGTEAAAATGGALTMKGMQLDFALFRADRPFFFFIEEPKSGLILFMGRVADPGRE
jgi:serpin B